MSEGEEKLEPKPNIAFARTGTVMGGIEEKVASTVLAAIAAFSFAFSHPRSSRRIFSCDSLSPRGASD
jgi:hypothetical protein